MFAVLDEIFFVAFLGYLMLEHSVVSYLELRKWLFLRRHNPRYIKVKVEHYLLFMFSPPKQAGPFQE